MRHDRVIQQRDGRSYTGLRTGATQQEADSKSKLYSNVTIFEVYLLSQNTPNYGTAGGGDLNLN